MSSPVLLLEHRATSYCLEIHNFVAHVLGQQSVHTLYLVLYHVCIAITYSKSKDQPSKVADPTRGQLNRENEYFSVPVRA